MVKNISNLSKEEIKHSFFSGEPSLFEDYINKEGKEGFLKFAELLKISGAEIVKEDFIPKGEPADLSRADYLIKKGCFGVFLDKLSEYGCKFEKSDFLKKHYREYNDKKFGNARITERGDSIFEAVLNSDFYKKTNHYIELKKAFFKNNIELNSSDFIDEKGFCNNAFSFMIRAGKEEDLIKTFEKDKRNINGDMIFHSDNKDNSGCAFEISAVNGRLGSLFRVIEKSGGSLKKDDFKRFCGERMALALAAESGEISFVQDICKKNKEKPFTIDDLDAKDIRIYWASNLEKILGIKGFSDKPNNLKKFWDKAPEFVKTDKNKKMYLRKLNQLIVNIIIDSTKGKNY